MKISTLTKKMIDYSKGNLHDINHFMKVHAYALMITDGENVNQSEREIIEVATIMHDIACPLCREKYGNTNGKYQEKEGQILVREFLKDSDYSKEFIERIVYLVGHHHTLDNITELDYQILIEADYLVNADEQHYSKENIKNVADKLFKTKTGLTLLKGMYLID